VPAANMSDQRIATGLTQTEPERLGEHPCVVVAHAGKQHAYRHAVAVQRAGCLERFVTSGYYCPERLPDRLFARWGRADRALRRRNLDGLDCRRIVRRWRLELPELIARRVFGNGAFAEELVYRRDAKFDRWVARRWAATGNVYWGFQGSCMESLRAARAAGKIAVAEFATAHVTLAIRLLAAECEKHPEWADSISNFRFPDWYRERLEQEPHEADVCIAASRFTKNSLLDVGIADERIKLLPLGADLGEFSPTPRSADGPFRIVFVGGVGQRKGIKYLLEAFQKMRAASTELVIVGPLMGSGRALEQYRGCYTYLGRLDQSGVIDEMRRSHVLVLPSVFEGFGLVIPEAMATGMPVIASTHSIGPEIIRDGEDGFVLEPDDVDGLAAKLDWLAGHRRAACEMGRAATQQAQSLSWERHGERVAELIGEISGHPLGELDDQTRLQTCHTR
jgi:glycosyltransferase involved in cell wall biosynthesis